MVVVSLQFPFFPYSLLGMMCLAGVIWIIQHRVRRRRLLARLATRHGQVVRDYTVVPAVDDATPWVASFAANRLVAIPNFLPETHLERLRAEATALIPQMVKSYIPTHKKGWTLSYEKIQLFAPQCLAFYHSPSVQQVVSRLVGQSVTPTPVNDQSSLSVLCYQEAGDHIHWHFDHNFYRGRHFTVLLSLANEREGGGCSSSQLLYRQNGNDQVVGTPPNTLVVFEGAQVLHRATPLGEGELRLILSMTYCVDPRLSWWKELCRRIKDTAFFGLRALWD